MKKISVALVGNPNSGKTTIFNALTGSRQKVGNYPGVTVEKKDGYFVRNDTRIEIVDLPGTYSLSAYSVEELVTRDYILDNKPDIVVDVVDASNLERNLFLAVQLIEMRVPLVLVFNMVDIAKNRGYRFDIEALSNLLGSRIVETVGSKEKGIDELVSVILDFKDSSNNLARINYGTEIEKELAKIDSLIDQEHELLEHYHRRWLCLKILENDKQIISKIKSKNLLEALEISQQRLKSLYNDDAEILIADRRYGFISGACEETVKSSVESRHEMSDKIDKIVTMPVVGLLIFAVVMFVVFWLTFTLGSYPMGWIETGIGHISHFIESHWPNSLSLELKSLVIDGILGGVGGVIVFLPNILLLFLGIAYLEDTGYMARAAFIMDRIMHKIGLHGKSFIPMLIGFGCSVPAIMSTRILENRRNRLTTIMVIPLMSCGAKLTVYTLFIPAFFAVQYRAFVMFSLYVIGIVLAIICAKLLRSTVFKGETTPFVMELPPYRMPTAKGLLIHMWDNGWQYLQKAGTVILLISIVLWAATRYPRPSGEEMSNFKPNSAAAQAFELEHSVSGRVGRAIEPVIKPLGFDWKIGTALIGAVAAKEVFVSQLGIVFSLGEAKGDNESLRQTLRDNYDKLTAFCIMLFTLISAPCFATVAITWKETKSVKWALFQFGGLTILAYVLTLITYQVGSLFIG